MTLIHRKKQRRGSDQSTRRGHKTAQLCKRVQEIVGLTLSSEDEQLEDLCLMAVQPLPDASRLLLIVSCPEGVSEADVRPALERVRGRLRQQIAYEINRKRTPELSFQVVESGWQLSE